MSVTTPRPVVRTGSPFYPVVFAVPVVCFTGALLTDFAYWRSAEMMWADFSAWLVSTGIVFGFIALIVWIVDALRGPFIRAQLPPWFVAVAYIVVLILGLLDTFIHTRDAWTSVVPWGLALSAITAIGLLVIGWMGRAAAWRDPVAIERVEAARVGVVP